MSNELEGVDKLIELGNAATGNQGFANLLQRRLDETGKPIDQLTVGEAKQLCDAARDLYNAIYR